MEIPEEKRYLRKYFNNPKNVLALILDLELVPAQLCTPDVIRLWKFKFLAHLYVNTPFEEFTKDYLLELSKRYSKLNHSRKFEEGDSFFRVEQLDLF